ncbi:hypothetical protein [Actinacidiphila sp. DG2A-62]|uniref:hypothetical protein n=1 Tax=Actinacidiphila sp. DG2A-62 TaxID=3108821 RepID=UPI003FA3CE26
MRHHQRRQGHQVTRCTVERLMRELGGNAYDNALCRPGLPSNGACARRSWLRESAG